MLMLPASHPDILTYFRDKKWTVQRQTNYGFSEIACDQTIEQICNRDAKTSGGITGFTLNRNAVRRRILSQSQRASINHQCEKLAGVTKDVKSRKDLDNSRKKRDEAIVRLTDCIKEMINPFNTNNGLDLVSISSGVVATDSVTKDLLEAYDIGDSALIKFIEERLTSNSKPFHEPIKQMKLKTFTNQDKLKMRTKSGKDVALQSDRKLFSRLLIISQHRKIDLKEVMKYSLGPLSYPLASLNGSLAKTNKSALLHLIEKQSQNHKEDAYPVDAALIIDGMALIQALPKQLPERLLARLLILSFQL
ncbi:hypothetical protein SNE40_014141 [Patella caerulea]|uniref:Uncharacterized protein n=1 Tax=Patella caerulea TaxID=87958 RepID=A0AAN8JKM9_PATCE